MSSRNRLRRLHRVHRLQVGDHVRARRHGVVVAPREGRRRGIGLDVEELAVHQDVVLSPRDLVDGVAEGVVVAVAPVAEGAIDEPTLQLLRLGPPLGRVLEPDDLGVAPEVAEEGAVLEGTGLLVVPGGRLSPVGQPCHVVPAASARRRARCTRSLGRRTSGRGSSGDRSRCERRLGPGSSPRCPGRGRSGTRPGGASR